MDNKTKILYAVITLLVLSNCYLLNKVYRTEGDNAHLMNIMKDMIGSPVKEQTDANESTPTTNTNEVDGTTEKPVKELSLEEKVVGTYEAKEDGDTYKLVFLENGIWEGYENGKKSKGDYKWSISKDGELHIVGKDGDIGVHRINKDGNITGIADIEDGKREDLPKEFQPTLIKIK